MKMFNGTITNTTIVIDGCHYNKRHGGSFDRGSADSYYGRAPRPHFFTDATYQSDEIEERFMTKTQIAEYYAGYEYNERFGDKKNWS